MSEPVLVEVRRGGRVESRHHGGFVVSDASGRIVLAAGDPEAAIFPRSAVKAFQALPLVETGAADRLGLDDASLALACASHDGQAAPVAQAGAMLARAGQTEACLECGTHWPSDASAARALAAAGKAPSALHNNCSGKHAGFVCLAVASGVPIAGYVRPEHPVMRLVTETVAAMTGSRLDDSNRATDGCSIPTYAVPLLSLARGFARFGSGAGLSHERAAACLRLRQAGAAHPDLVAGERRFDTRLMRALGQRAFVKVGAEGVHCGALPELGLGFAIKCGDGAHRASEVVAAALVERLLQVELAPELTRPVLRNWNGMRVGEVRACLPG